jgi:hypothetical protein
LLAQIIIPCSWLISEFMKPGLSFFLILQPVSFEFKNDIQLS